MKFPGSCVLVVLLSSGALSAASASTASQASTEQAIRGVLDVQVDAWNRGDLERFVSTYASQCTLVGGTISETTREQVLAHYREKYPSPEARGHLTFADLSVRPLDSKFAVVTGRWHLDREKSTGGPVGGVFSLVFEFSDGSWEIILDHTS